MNKKGNKIKHTHSHASQILPFVNDKKDIVFYFDPSTAKFSQKQISTKIPNFLL